MKFSKILILISFMFFIGCEQYKLNKSSEFDLKPEKKYRNTGFALVYSQDQNQLYSRISARFSLIFQVFGQGPWPWPTTSEVVYSQDQFQFQFRFPSSSVPRFSVPQFLGSPVFHFHSSPVPRFRFPGSPVSRLSISPLP